MADYISREAVLRAFKLIAKNPNKDYQRGMQDTIECLVPQVIADIPASDVQPIKHGRWIAQGNDMWLCSNCNENKIFSMHESDRTEKQRYCCKCGARMDGEQNETIKRAYTRAAAIIEQITAEDVQPIRHGRWVCNEELYYNGMTKCSCCNEEYYTEDIQNLQGDLRTVNFCPNCGARMDLND